MRNRWPTRNLAALRSFTGLTGRSRGGALGRRSCGRPSSLAVSASGGSGSPASETGPVSAEARTMLAARSISSAAAPSRGRPGRGVAGGPRRPRQDLALLEEAHEAVGHLLARQDLGPPLRPRELVGKLARERDARRQALDERPLLLGGAAEALGREVLARGAAPDGLLGLGLDLAGAENQAAAAVTIM